MVPSLPGWEMVMAFKTQGSRFKRKTTELALDMLRLRKVLKLIRLQKTEVERL